MSMPPYLSNLRAKVGHDLLLLPTVCGLVFDARGRLLVGRRVDTGTWELVGGYLDPGEEVADAVVREVLEETGVLVRPDRITGVYTSRLNYPNGDAVSLVSTTFWCTPIDGEARVNDDESLEVGYFPVDVLPPLPDEHMVRVRDALRGEPAARFRRQHSGNPAPGVR